MRPASTPRSCPHCFSRLPSTGLLAAHIQWECEVLKARRDGRLGGLVEGPAVFPDTAAGGAGPVGERLLADAPTGLRLPEVIEVCVEALEVGDVLADWGPIVEVRPWPGGRQIFTSLRGYEARLTAGFGQLLPVHRVAEAVGS